MERPLRSWVHRLLPWAAFAVALVFAFAQLAARHDGSSAAPAGASSPVQPGPAATSSSNAAAGASDPADDGVLQIESRPRAAPLFAARAAIPDRSPQERLESLLAVARARVAALEREATARQALPPPEPPAEVREAPVPPSDPLAQLLQDAGSENAVRVRAARRKATGMTPLHVRRMALLVGAHPELAVGARALLDRLPASRATDALRRELLE